MQYTGGSALPQTCATCSMSGMLCLSGFAACLNLHLQIQPSSTVLCSAVASRRTPEVQHRERGVLRERLRERGRAVIVDVVPVQLQRRQRRVHLHALGSQNRRPLSRACRRVESQSQRTSPRPRSRIVAANASAHATCKPSIANGHICLEGPYATAHMVETWDSIVMSHLQHLRQQRGTLVANVVAAQVQPPHARVACACRCANP